VKRASPSRGPIAPDVDAAALAGRYLTGGASAISVLTEPAEFLGSLDDLSVVAGLGAPTLRKDFIVDPYQVWEARAAGASAVLLIVAALDDVAMTRLIAACTDAGLDALMEVHDEAEARTATDTGARLIGVNARDLTTFEVDAGAVARLRPRLPSDAIVVAESGVRGPADVRAVAAAGADAVLVGEHLVVSADPAGAVAELVAAGREHTGDAA